MNINEKFFLLDEEKRLRIINAGMRIFGTHGFQKGNTEDIAREAGISKGLLFYYFKNKEAFYIYLCEHCNSLMLEAATNKDIFKIDDFFLLIEEGSKLKLQLIAQYPYITDFSLVMFQSMKDQKDSLSKEHLNEIMDNSFDTYFNEVDFSRFKDDVEPKDIYFMIAWLSEGYLSHTLSVSKEIDVEHAFQQIHKFCKLLKIASYKEEYQ